MKYVILPTDFSPNADKAMKFAFMIAKTQGLELIAANAYDLPYTASVMTTSLLDIMKETSESGLKEIRERAEKEGIKCTTHSRMGNPIRLVRDLSVKYPESIVVMGTKGASGIEEVLIGSNTATVLHTVDVPVLAIPEKAKVDAFKKIVYATDYKSQRDHRALARLTDLARLFGGEIKVIHVKGKDVIATDETIAKIEKYFGDVPHSIHEVEGKNVEGTILDFAEKENANLVALLARKYGLIEGLFHKSSTSKVAYSTKIPFLALHEVD